MTDKAMQIHVRTVLFMNIYSLNTIVNEPKYIVDVITVH